MTTVWFSIAFVAVMFWTAGALLDKYIIGRFFHTVKNDVHSGVGTLLLFSAFFSIFVFIFVLVYAPQELSFGQSTLWALCGGLFNVGWLLLYLHTIDRTELSRSVPIFQIIPVFGYVFGFFLLGESLETKTLMAGTVIVIGAFLLSYHFSSTGNWFDGSTVYKMSAASMLVALSEIFFKQGALLSNYWNTALWFSLGVVLGGIILYLGVSPYRRQFNAFIATKNYQIFGLNGFNEVLDNLGNFVFVYALTLGPVALVMMVNAYQPLIILIASGTLSYFFPKYYDEDFQLTSLLQKSLGIAIITAGSIYLYATL